MNNPTPAKSLPVSLAEEIAREVGSALDSDDLKRFRDHIEKEIIQRRVEPLERALEQIATARNGCQECDEFDAGCICLKCEVKRAIARIKEGRL